MCDAPPLSQIRIVDLALPFDATAALAISRSENPQKPKPLAARKVRRDRAVRTIWWPVSIDFFISVAQVSNLCGTCGVHKLETCATE